MTWRHGDCVVIVLRNKAEEWSEISSIQRVIVLGSASKNGACDWQKLIDVAKKTAWKSHDRIVSTNKVNRDWWRQQTTFSQKMIWLYLFLCSVNELSLVTPAYKSGVLFIGIFWPPSKRRAHGKNSKNYPWGKVPIINLLGSQEIPRLAK